MKPKESSIKLLKTSLNKKVKVVITGSLLFFCLLTFTNAYIPGESGKNESPEIKWLSDTIAHLGKFEINKPKVVIFEFLNKGKTPLLINRVQPSCGCTSIDYSKDPIEAGQKGFVKTTYNASSVGVFNKTITVFTNTSIYSSLLTIKGEVVPKKE